MFINDIFDDIDIDHIAFGQNESSNNHKNATSTIINPYDDNKANEDSNAKNLASSRSNYDETKKIDFDVDLLENDMFFDDISLLGVTSDKKAVNKPIQFADTSNNKSKEIEHKDVTTSGGITNADCNKSNKTSLMKKLNHERGRLL